MVRERLIDRDTALLRVDPGALQQLLVKTVDPSAKYTALTQGLAATAAAAAGRVVLPPRHARWRRRCARTEVILVRAETSPEDVAGMHASQGILTARGGLTSHAAVVARGLGQAVRRGRGRRGGGRGAAALPGRPRRWCARGRRDHARRRDRRGRPERAPARATRRSRRSSRSCWTGRARSSTTRVRANADTPEDARQGARVRRRGHRARPDRAHVLRRGPHPHRPRDDHGRATRRRARRRWTGSCPSSARTSWASSPRWTACR